MTAMMLYLAFYSTYFYPDNLYDAGTYVSQEESLHLLKPYEG